MKRTPIPRKRAKPRRVSVVRCRKYLVFLVENAWCSVCGLDYSINPYLVSDADRWFALSKVHMHSLFPDPAHTTNNGMSSKGGDDTCAPLCREHHRLYDADRKAFERKYGVDMRAVAKAWWDLFNRKKEVAQ